MDEFGASIDRARIQITSALEDESKASQGKPRWIKRSCGVSLK